MAKEDGGSGGGSVDGEEEPTKELAIQWACLVVLSPPLYSPSLPSLTPLYWAFVVPFLSGWGILPHLLPWVWPCDLFCPIAGVPLLSLVIRRRCVSTCWLAALQ